MKKNEKWEHWDPMFDLTDKFYIDLVLDSIEGFKILLSDEHNKKVVQVFYENSVDAYRNSDETYRLKLIGILDEKYGGDFYAKRTFFKVLNSDYMNWLSDQSCGISNDRSLQHFCFIADNSVLDVISPIDPKVEFL